MVSKLEAFLDRFPWLLPLTGFVGGWVSFILVHRGDELAKLTAVIVLIGWLWLMILPFITKYARLYTGRKITVLLSSFVTQSIQQEILFFVLPFLVLSTQIKSPGQVIIALVLLLAALISTLDPVYEKYIACKRFMSLMFHSLCSFVSALVILPIVVKVPVEQSFFYALGFVVLGLLIGLPETLQSINSIKQKALVVLTICLVPLVITSLRAYIPAAGIVVSDATITDQVNEHMPGQNITRVSMSNLEKGLYAYAKISAPMGLSQNIVFEWQHGSYVESIVSTITGGREDGYRTYSFKENFIEDPVGKWTVQIMTPQRQLLESMQFQVVE